MFWTHAIRAALSGRAALSALCLAGLARAALLLPEASAARSAKAVAAAAPQCRNATQAGAGRAQERTILCLINAERARAGVSRLRRNGALARAAERHARDMTRRDYFAHVSPSGATPLARAIRAGYGAATLAENLAFGTGSWGTPAGAVAQWLDSPGHRRAMLSPAVRELGVGAVSGSPMAGVSGGVTVAAEFGRR